MPSGSLPLSRVSDTIALILLPKYSHMIDSARGYHGYWASNLYATNSHYGTSDELKGLVNAAHGKVSM